MSICFIYITISRNTAGQGADPRDATLEEAHPENVAITVRITAEAVVL